MLETLRKVTYTALAAVDQKLDQPKPKATIMCYHSMADDDWQYSVAPETFRHQVAALSREYTFVSLQEIESYLKQEVEFSEPSMAFTFDDGYADLMEIVDIVGDYAIIPTVFLLADPANARYAELQTRRPFLNQSQIRELSNIGWTFGSHTATHPTLTNIPDSEYKAEIGMSKRKIEDILLGECRWFAYPKGRYNQRVVDAVGESGYSLALTMDDRTLDQEVDPLKVPRVGVNNHSIAEVLALNSLSNQRLRRLLKGVKYSLA